MTITDVKECAIDRSRVVVHIRPFKLLKTLYGSCFMLATVENRRLLIQVVGGGSK